MLENQRKLWVEEKARGVGERAGRREEGRERLRSGRVGQRRGRVKGARVVREQREGEWGGRKGEREGRGRSEKMEKCGDIAVERMV